MYLLKLSIGTQKVGATERENNNASTNSHSPRGKCIVSVSISNELPHCALQHESSIRSKVDSANVTYSMCEFQT